MDLAHVRALVATGDTAALGVLYDHLAPAAFGIAHTVLSDDTETQQVIEAVFVEVFHTASRYEASRWSVSTWVLTLAHARAVDRARSQITSVHPRAHSLRAADAQAGDGPKLLGTLGVSERDPIRAC